MGNITSIVVIMAEIVIDDIHTLLQTKPTIKLFGTPLQTMPYHSVDYCMFHAHKVN